MPKKIYKDEDSKTIYEFLKEFDAETNRRVESSAALKRQLLRGKQAEEELKKCKKLLEEREGR